MLLYTIFVLYILIHDIRLFIYTLSCIAALMLPSSLPPTVTEVKVNTNEMPYQCYQYLQSRCANDGLRTHPSAVHACPVCILKSGRVVAMPLKGYQGKEGWNINHHNNVKTRAEPQICKYIL